MSEDQATPLKGGLERHVQTLVTSVTLALLMWTGVTLVDLRDRLARMEEKIITLNAEIQRAQTDRFTMSDWRREKEVLEDRFSRLEKESDFYHRNPLNRR